MPSSGWAEEVFLNSDNNLDREKIFEIFTNGKVIKEWWHIDPFPFGEINPNMPRIK